MTLSQMLQILYDRLDYEDAPPASIVRRLTGYINETQREVFRLKGMSALRRRVLPFSTIASSPYAVMAQPMSQVFACVDRTENNVLYPRDVTWIWGRDPGQTLTGSPDCFALLDYMAPVVQDVPTAAQLYAVSTSASDTTQNVYLEGIDENGYRRTAGPVTLTGTTPVSLSSTITNWLTVTRWYMSASAVGFVSVQNSTPLVLGTITPGELRPAYTKLLLSPTPDSVQTLYAYGMIEIYDLVNAFDYSLFPADFAHVLVSGALEKEFMKREKPPMAGLHMRKKDETIKDLRAFLQSAQAQQTNGQSTAGFSALGPYFPSGT